MIYFLDNEILIKDIHIGVSPVFLPDVSEDSPCEIILKDDFYHQTHYLSEIIEYFQDIPKSIIQEVSQCKYEISIKRLPKEDCEEENNED